MGTWSLSAEIQTFWFMKTEQSPSQYILVLTLDILLGNKVAKFKDFLQMFVETLQINCHFYWEKTLDIACQIRKSFDWKFRIKLDKMATKNICKFLRLSN